VYGEYADAAALFLGDNGRPGVGDIWCQPQLTKMLRRIQAAGPRDFYEGEIARELSRAITAAGGVISEADLAINPNIRASDGSGGPGFSTDGTHDTFDLESTFVHEIGHMLGLEHSGVVGASMQPRQVRNFFDLKQPTPRTLSDDDIAGIRSLYGRAPRQPSGSIAGTINYGAGAHVFAENVGTGRVHGSAITFSDGTYRIEHLPPGTYRVVGSLESAPPLDGNAVEIVLAGP
jgi:hypothetical protein